MKMSTWWGGLSSGPVGGESGVTIAAVAASSTAAAKDSSLKLQLLHVGDSCLLCDVLAGRVRPLVPATLCPRVFNQLHSIAHQGVRATRHLIAARFVWTAMAADVDVWCRDCVACIRAKITRHVEAPVLQMEVPRRRFSHIHVDLVGPLPVSKDGFSHLFTMVNRSTRWPEAIPLCTTSTEDCVEALISGWVARFSVPADITSDRGIQFSSGVCAVLCQRLGISHHSTTAFHPQSDGMVERFHRQLKDALRAHLQGQDWVSQLPWVLLGLRAAPKEKANIRVGNFRPKNNSAEDGIDGTNGYFRRNSGCSAEQ
jgi:hypothetical protein